MTRSNRFTNRLLILLAGLVLIAAGAWVLAPRAAKQVGLALALPGYPRPDAQALWIAAAALVVLAVLALAWAFTRGRGRTSRVLVVDGADGGLTVDATVASDLIAHELDADPDVLAVSASAFRVRRSTVLSVRVTARRGADLQRVIDATALAIESLDGALETRMPVVLHVASGVRAALAREPRAR